MLATTRRPKRRRHSSSSYIPCGSSLENRLQSIMLSSADEDVDRILSQLPSDSKLSFRNNKNTSISSSALGSVSSSPARKRPFDQYSSTTHLELTKFSTPILQIASPLPTPTSTDTKSACFTPSTATPSFLDYTPQSTVKRARSRRKKKKLLLSPSPSPMEQKNNREKEQPEEIETDKDQSPKQQINGSAHSDEEGTNFISQTSDGLEMLLIASQTTSSFDDAISKSPEKKN